MTARPPDADPLAPFLPGLRARYAEPHRRHHDQGHVDAMLRGLAELSDAVTDPATVAVAVWYHDAVYDPTATDNEELSASLLREEMTPVLSPTALSDAVAMVLATKDHALPVGTRDDLVGDMGVLLDLDLAVLGADPMAYDAYERGIAAEHVPVFGPRAYAAGRETFLRSMIARDRIFVTERFHEALDARARANVARALDATES